MRQVVKCEINMIQKIIEVPPVQVAGKSVSKVEVTVHENTVEVPEVQVVEKNEEVPEVQWVVKFVGLKVEEKQFVGLKVEEKFVGLKVEDDEVENEEIIEVPQVEQKGEDRDRYLPWSVEEPEKLVGRKVEDDKLEDDEITHQENADMENKLVELRKEREQRDQEKADFEKNTVDPCKKRSQLRSSGRSMGSIIASRRQVEALFPESQT